MILWQSWSFLAPAFDPSIERNVLRLVALHATALGGAGSAFGVLDRPPARLAVADALRRHAFHEPDSGRRPTTRSPPPSCCSGSCAVFELPMFGARSGEHRRPLVSRLLRRNRRSRLLHRRRDRARPTRPDPVTTGLELLPMWALFSRASIWLAVFVERARPDAGRGSLRHGRASTGRGRPVQALGCCGYGQPAPGAGASAVSTWPLCAPSIVVRPGAAPVVRRQEQCSLCPLARARRPKQPRSRWIVCSTSRTFANAYAALCWASSRTRDGLLCVEADAIRGAVPEVGPRPAVREAAVSRNVEGGQLVAVGLGQDERRVVRRHDHAVWERSPSATFLAEL